MSRNPLGFAVLVAASVLFPGCFALPSAAYYDPVKVYLGNQSGSECGRVTTGRHRIRFYYSNRELGKTYDEIRSEVTPRVNKISLTFGSQGESVERVDVAVTGYTKFDNYYFTTIKNDLKLRAGVYCLSYSGNELEEAGESYFDISGIPSP